MPYSVAAAIVPVRTSRQWTAALAPNARGDWNLITFSYELHDQAPTEWAINHDLTRAPRLSIVKGTPTVYPNSNFQIANELRFPNGRILFVMSTNHLAWYCPITETVYELPQVVDPSHKRTDDLFYSATIGPDGKAYLGTQSQSLPMVCQVDMTATPPVARIMGHVGKNRVNPLSYAYRGQADTSTWRKIAYIAVGKDPWELCALDLVSGVSTVLLTAPATGDMSFTTRPEGIVCKVHSAVGLPGDVVSQYWCVDGVLYPYSPGYTPSSLPFTPRSVAPMAAPVVGAPLIDTSPGIGIARWRWSSADEWTDVRYQVGNTVPVKIESLTALPGGAVFGSVEQYLGFWHYDPASGAEVDWFGAWAAGMSRAVTIVINGIVWICGYPEAMLWSYDPGKLWNPGVNPAPHGNFKLSGMKRPARLDYNASNGRIYCAGQREREGFGGALGWYDIARGTFGGTYAGLEWLTPEGLAVIDELGLVVFSGSPSPDPSRPSPPPDAELVLVDPELRELARQWVLGGLKSTGKLYRTAAPHVLVGLTEGLIYRHDILAGSVLLDRETTDGPIGHSRQDPNGGPILAVMGGILRAIDPETLAICTVSDDPVFATTTGFINVGAELMVANGATLSRLVPTP